MASHVSDAGKAVRKNTTMAFTQRRKIVMAKKSKAAKPKKVVWTAAMKEKLRKMKERAAKK
jgi:ribosomal protein L24E